MQCQGELAVPEEDENSDVDKVGFVKDSHDIPRMNSLPLQEEEEFMNGLSCLLFGPGVSSAGRRPGTSR